LTKKINLKEIYMTTNNTLAQKAARRKLSLLELASDLDNVSKACKLMGYSREQFYEIRRNFQAFGADGLLDKAKGAKSPHPNRLSQELEKAVLDYCLEFPIHGPLKTSRQLLLKGVHVGAGQYGASGRAMNLQQNTKGCCALKNITRTITYS
jgi:hypothetical protein